MVNIQLCKILSMIWEKEITEIEFCEAIGVNKTTVTEWKKGKHKSYLKHIDKIANFFGVDKEYIISDKTSYNGDVINNGNIEGDKNNVIFGHNSKVTTSVQLTPLEQDLIRIFNVLSPRAQVKFMDMAYKYEEEYQKTVQ